MVTNCAMAGLTNIGGLVTFADPRVDRCNSLMTNHAGVVAFIIPVNIVNVFGA